MNDIFNILMVGVGGQGIILASDIITLAAMKACCDAKKSEIHGMSQRGGSVFSHVRFGKKVYSPVIPECGADILVSLEEMETLRWLGHTHQGTKLIFAKNRILPANVHEYPHGIEKELLSRFSNAVAVDPEAVTAQTGNQKFVSTAILGKLSTFVDFPASAWEEAITELVPSGTAEGNLKAFAAGKSL
jgi:indolepyruvate ferredoxin oxidoreductase beta subunit